MQCVLHDPRRLCTELCGPRTLPGNISRRRFQSLGQRRGWTNIENEDLVNLPNWLPLTFRIDDGPEFSVDSAELLQYRQELDLRQGILRRSLVFRAVSYTH